MMAPRKSQFSGCLLGQCLADALGMPVEGLSPQDCNHYVEAELKTNRAGQRSRGGFPFGQYTDDSQLARELIQSYVNCGEFDPSDYAGRIAAIFTEDRIVGRGRSTHQAAMRLAQGVPWEEAGTPSPSAGNGSAMRAAPIGLMFYEDPEALIRAARDQGRITHQDPRCSAGAVAIASGTAFALQHETIQPDAFFSLIEAQMAQVEPEFAKLARQLKQWVKLPPLEAASRIAPAGLPEDASTPVGISPFVVPSVLWSLYAFARSPHNYLETVCTAIAVGGDVDTTAAMAGAISGAYVGLEGLPPDLVRQVSDRGTWEFDELVDLAERCYTLK